MCNYHRFRLITILIFFFLISNSVVAQTLTIVSKADLGPISGVFVYTNDFSLAVATDEDGKADISRFKNEPLIIIQHPAFKNVTTSYPELKELNFKLSLVESVVGLDEVTISVNKWEQKTSEVPNKMARISAKKIAFDNPQTSADLLENTNEVFVQKSQLGGGSPMIRGFSANRLLIVVDGIRMNNVIYRSGNLQNVLSVDPASLESAEVIFGPGTIIYGSDALGGVLNFNTVPVKLSSSGKYEMKGSSFIRYSTASKEQSENVMLNFRFKKWGFVTGLSFSEFGDLRAGSNRNEDYPYFGMRNEYVAQVDGRDTVMLNSNPDVQIGSAYTKTNILQKIRFKPNDSIDVNLNFVYSTTSDVPRYDRLIQYSDNTLKYAEWYYGPQDWLMGSLNMLNKHKTKLYDQLKISLAYQNYEESRHDRKLYATDLRSRTEQLNIYSLNIDLDKELSPATHFYYGFEEVINTVTSSGIKTNILNGDVVPSASRYPDGGTFYNIGALYSSLKTKLNQKLDFTGGVRYSNIYLNSEFDTNPYDFSFSNLNIQTGALNGSLGIVAHPIEELQLNVNVGSGFRAPNLDDVGKVFDSEPGNVVVPNDNLQSEYAYNADFGLNWNIQSIAELKLSAFYTYLDNAMVRRDYTYVDQDGVEHDSILYDDEMSKVEAIVNTGYAHLWGGNAMISFDLTEKIGITSSANFTYGIDDEDLPMRHVPPFFGNTSVFYTTNRLKASLYCNYNAARKLEDMAPSEQDKAYLYTEDGAPAWYTLNMKLSYQLHKNIQVNCGLENILDVHYRPYSSGISAPGRNFYLTLRASL